MPTVNMQFALAFAEMSAINNAVVSWRLYYIHTLKQELGSA